MGRAKTSEADTPTTEDTAMPSAETPPAGEAATLKKRRKRRKISKTEAVRRALDTLGREAANTDIQKFIRDRYKIQMKPTHISSCKSTLLKALREQGDSVADGPPRSAGRPPGRPSDNLSLGELRSIKELVDRVGVKKFREVLDLLYP
jgi:hypothetical protein